MVDMPLKNKRTTQPKNERRKKKEIGKEKENKANKVGYTFGCTEIDR